MYSSYVNMNQHEIIFPTSYKTCIFGDIKILAYECVHHHEWGYKRPIALSRNDADFFLVTIYTLELTLTKFQFDTILF